MLDIEVLRYLYKESVKNFIRENNINFNWNENDERLVSLFNTIDNQEKRSFLEREILYGMQRNIYISKIDENINHINDERIAIEIINSFNEYTNGRLFTDQSFTDDCIGRKINIDEHKLLHYNIHKDQMNNVDRIDIILATCMSNEADGDDEGVYIYYSITIDTVNNLLIIRMRNMDTIHSDFKVDEQYDLIKEYILNKIDMRLVRNDDNFYRMTIYNIVDYVNNTVLNNFYRQIDESIGDNIEQSVLIWNEELPENEINDEERLIIINNIKNSYCKLISQNRLQNLTPLEIKNLYNVDGYVNRVKFEDDSIGNTRVKSTTIKETLLNTSTFYDIKASMERGRNIKEANIQWLDQNNDRINVVFNNEKQGKFKVIIKNNYFNERMDRYVLQKIIQYSPR
ncbi:hypothetical protein [uncultured Romboutsia sp.]|uniref:hypothetical protein n=1 Tax=uncultured Romboutsia sp. TaxID=1505656 RepID=UPI00266C176B|nr:hypothetical protein [uncultured Romboutsia sp.]